MSDRLQKSSISGALQKMKYHKVLPSQNELLPGWLFTIYCTHTHTHTQKQQLLLCPQHLIEATWTVWRKTNTWSELSATREQPSSFLCFLNSSHLELFLPFSPRFSLSFKMFFLPCLFDNITAFWVWPAHGFWVLPELTVLMMMMMIIKQNNKH